MENYHRPVKGRRLFDGFQVKARKGEVAGMVWVPSPRLQCPSPKMLRRTTSPSVVWVPERIVRHAPPALSTEIT